MDLHYLFKGILIGISVSAPLGPMGVLVIQRTIHKGLPSGFASGGGVVIGDTIYAIIAGFGLTFVSSFLEQNQLLFRIFGGLILLFMGYKMFKATQLNKPNKERKKQKNLFLDFISVLALTLSNPFTVIAFGAVFAGFNIFANSNNTTTVVVAGIFLGAIIWWLILSLLINYMRSRINSSILMKMNKITGALVVVLGLVAFFSVFV